MASYHKHAMTLGPLVLLMSCSPGSLYTNESPVALSKQIAAADRVLLTDSNGLAPVHVEFSGTNAQELVRAVSGSKKIKTSKDKDTGSGCPGGVYISFYTGTNLLAQLPAHEDHFHTYEGIYHDGTGALQTAWKPVYEQRSR